MKYIRNIIFLTILLAIWQIPYILHPSRTFFMPSPLEVVQALFDSFKSGEASRNILISIQRVVVGFSVASLIGISLGIVCGYYKNLGNYFQPFVEMLRPIPPIAWIPIAILLFGLSNNSSYFIVFLGAFFPIFTNSFLGARSLPQVYKNVSETFELGTYKFLAKVLFPFSLPYIFSGLKIGIGTAWMSVIAAELIGAQSGLGYFIQLNRLLLRTDNIVAGMILIGLVGLFLSQILNYSEHRLILWKK